MLTPLAPTILGFGVVGVVSNVLMLLSLFKEHRHHQLPSPAYCLAGFASADLFKLAGWWWEPIIWFGVYSGTAWLGAYALSLHQELCGISTRDKEAGLVQNSAAFFRTRWSGARCSRVLIRWTLCWLVPIAVVGATILAQSGEQGGHLRAYSRNGTVVVFHELACFYHHTWLPTTLRNYTGNVTYWLARNSGTYYEEYAPCSVEVLLVDLWTWLAAAVVLACFVVIQLHLTAQGRRVKANLDEATAARLQQKLRVWPYFALYLAAFFVCPLPMSILRLLAPISLYQSEDRASWWEAFYCLSASHSTVNLVVYGGTQVWFSRGLRCRRAVASFVRVVSRVPRVEGDHLQELSGEPSHILHLGT